MKNNISELLKNKGMTQREFSKKLNTTEVSVSRYIRGERVPNGPLCIKMANILGCKVEDLFYEEQEIALSKDADFMSRIISEICDYAKDNGYAITDTVKTIGDNLVAITEIANFDGWKGGASDE